MQGRPSAEPLHAPDHSAGSGPPTDDCAAALAKTANKPSHGTLKVRSPSATPRAVPAEVTFAVQNRPPTESFAAVTGAVVTRI